MSRNPIRIALARLPRSVSARFAVCLLILMPGIVAAEIAGAFRWVVDMEQPMQYALPPIRRGETVHLEPTYKLYGSPRDLSSAHLVVFRYKPTAWAAGSGYSVITGSVINATGGQVRVTWTSAAAYTNNFYVYELAVQSVNETMIRSYGKFSLISGVTDDGATSATPTTVTLIDWATTENSNIGDAPFLSSFLTADLQAFDASLIDGTADISVHSITSQLPYKGSAEALTGFPSYLARTNQITLNTVTSVVAGASEVGGRIERVDANRVVVHFPITAEGEEYTTNRLYWLVDGQAVGYVSTNGITMLKGSLELYEDDLNCNVRAYDGAAAAPSVSFFASPLSGWYRASVAGAGAWAYAHNSNSVGYIYNEGWVLLGDRGFTGSYMDLSYCDVSEGYRVGGTNYGRTTNITVVTGILTNGSGAVTGLMSQTLQFIGGMLK